MKHILAVLLFAPCVAGATCFRAAIDRYIPQVDPLLLQAMAKVESNGQVDAEGPVLADGNKALGLMQINTVHLPELERYGIRREDLFDACKNVNLGAWALSHCIRRFGMTWRAVGCYNTGPASRNLAAQQRYITKVRRHYERLTNGQGLISTTGISAQKNRSPRSSMAVWEAE